MDAPAGTNATHPCSTGSDRCVVMEDEITKRLALSRHQTHRRAERRENEKLWEELRLDPSTRVVLVHKSQVLLSENALVEISLQDFDLVDKQQSELFYLGETTGLGPDSPPGAHFVAVNAEQAHVEAFTQDSTWHDLKKVGHLLSDRDAGLATQAIAITNWHATYKFSPATGIPTEIVHGGWARQHGDIQDFPRTDPAVIVLVTDNRDRLLMGNNALWESNIYSLLAGFVEPGESLESAVIREVQEEAGLEVVNPTYLASQPWPFPRSLMLGFRAELAPEADPEAIFADGVEIRHLRWFTREELIANEDKIVFPGPSSISRVMIEHWLGKPLDQDRKWDK